MFIKPAKKNNNVFSVSGGKYLLDIGTRTGPECGTTLKRLFTNFETSYANIGKCRLDRYELNHSKKTLHVYANANFGYQPFTPENTEAIYRLLKQSLPALSITTTLPFMQMESRLKN